MGFFSDYGPARLWAPLRGGTKRDKKRSKMARASRRKNRAVRLYFWRAANSRSR